jgi:hypothetical protein
MDEKNLHELFAPPIGLKEVDNIYGFRLYSSDRIVEAYLNAIKKSGRGNKVYKPIEALVRSKKIMPVFQVKGILKFFSHKMFGNPEDKAILGFYHMGIKKVYIMIENNISSIAHAKNDDIASTTIHECQHLFADMNRAKFTGIFKEELYRYYAMAFSRIFSLKQTPKDLQKIITFIGTFEGEGLNNVSSKLKKYEQHLMMLKKDSSLSSEDFDKRVREMLMVINLFVNHFDTFVRAYRKFVHIVAPLDRAYMDAFGKSNRYTTAYQELISISEVICVLSEIKPGYPKIKKVFQTFS